MSISLQLGLGTIRSFRRLSYTVSYALAEFVDNSTQSYRDHRSELDKAYRREGRGLEVSIDYLMGVLTVEDNAMGMSQSELEHALTVGAPPEGVPWRSRYGFGLKTAASWFGDSWTVETKRLDETVGYRITVDVEAVANGDAELKLTELTDLEPESHFTKITISDLNRPIRGGAIPAVKRFLTSMYQEDLRNETLRLVCFGEVLPPPQDAELASDELGRVLRRDIDFRVDGKHVTGWAGVLARGGRAKAGFSMLHAGRVIMGPPTAWRPSEIFGQPQGSNNLVNQRVTGQVVLDAFEVSQTKDNILWLDDEEQKVELALRAQCQDLVDAAKRLRRTGPSVAPTRSDVRSAALNVQGVLASSELGASWLPLRIPSHDTLEARQSAALSRTRQRGADFVAYLDGVNINGYLDRASSPDEEYRTSGLDGTGILSIIVNLNHPHVVGMDAATLTDHVKHCVYEALSNWKARRDGLSDEDTIGAFLKDALLRIPSPNDSGAQ